MLRKSEIFNIFLLFRQKNYPLYGDKIFLNNKYIVWFILQQFWFNDIIIDDL